MAPGKTVVGKRRAKPRRSANTAKSNGPARTSKWQWSNPEWEAMKARCRNLSHRDAVAEAASLSRDWRLRWRPMTPDIKLLDIVRALTKKKIPFVLTGAHGISGWTGRPRATHDVDILVSAGRNHGRAVKAVRELYPTLEVHQLPGLAAFFVPGEKESVIDVTYPHRDDHVVTLQTGVWVDSEGARYRVPTLECALANKYGAMLNLTREVGKRALDAVDFYNMVKHTKDADRLPVDLKLLAELGDKVWSGGGKELVQIFEDAKAGKVPNLTPTQKSPP
jgi:hypothetical protein